MTTHPPRNARNDALSDTDAAAVRHGVGSLLFTGILLGIGIAGFIDETVFHQLLQWHNFYWGTDEHGRILSDGLFHAGSTLVLLWGAFRLWVTPRPWVRGTLDAVLGGVLIGAGGFNTYDGIIQHVIFHLHLVNEHVCPTLNANNSVATCPADIPYEIVWIGVGIVVVVVGVVLFRRGAHTLSGGDATTAMPGRAPTMGPTPAV